MSDYRRIQHDVAKIALEASGSADFALAGSGAIREHGLISRPTEDVDLFTIQQKSPQFESAVDKVVAALRDHNYEVRESTRLIGFARLTVTDVDTHSNTVIDMGIDWRSSPPVRMDVGPVLDERDAVGNKVAALFSRGELRDYFDVDSIRRNGPFSDRELLDLAQRADPGFSEDFFAQALLHFEDFDEDSGLKYGVDQMEFHDIRKRLLQFSNEISQGRISTRKPTEKSKKNLALLNQF